MNQNVQAHTDAWVTFTYASFAASAFLVALGVFFLPIDLSRRLVWGDARPPRVPIVALIAVSIVAGFLIGNALAGAITGRPVFG